MTVNLIISIDPLSDCDDFLGLAVLHAMIDRGECNILAILDCTSATNGISAIDAMNTFYKHDIPLGKWTGEFVYAGRYLWLRHFTGRFAA